MTTDEQAERAFERTVQRAEHILNEIEEAADDPLVANAELVSIIGYLMGMMDTIRQVAPSPQLEAIFDTIRKAGRNHAAFRQDHVDLKPKANV